MKPSPYLVLGMPPASTAEALHARYIVLARETAPRRMNDAEDRFKEIALAWGQLKNSELRARYDAQLKLEKRWCSRCNGAGLVKGFRNGKYRTDLVCPVCTGHGLN